MTAAVLYGREDVRIEQVDAPVAGPGEVRLRIAAALTCGTDVKVYRRGYHARMIRPPAVFGHELCGIIDAVGPGVTKWSVGQRVVAANSAPCDSCYYCRNGQKELCDDLLFLNGAYAEYIRIPPRIVQKNMYEAPASVPSSHAAMAEPLACVVRAMEAVRPEPGASVVVIGAGPIGLMFVRMCALAGAKVIAVGRRKTRLELAGKLGAASVLDIDDVPYPRAGIAELTDGKRGPDIVIEAVGRPDAWDLALSLPRKGGKVCLFGGCEAGTTVSIDTHRLHYHQLTLLGAFHHNPKAFRKALDLIGSGQVDPGLFIQQSAPLTGLPALLSSLAAGKADLVKAAVIPDS